MLPPPLPHQVEVLQRVLDRVAVTAADGGPPPLVVFGLDGTLYDNRPRTLQIMLEYADDVRHSAPDVAAAIEGLDMERIHFLLSETLRECGLIHADVIRDVTHFWRERFFSDDYATLDLASEGAAEYVGHVYAAGAGIVYLSGRDVPSMLIGTIARLRDDGFPLASPGVQVVLKPDSTLGDESFKRTALRQLHGFGEVIACFDSSAAICEMARRIHPKAEIGLVDTWQMEVPEEGARIELVRDFRGA